MTNLAGSCIYLYIASFFLGVVLTQTLFILPSLWWGVFLLILLWLSRRFCWLRPITLFLVAGWWSILHAQLLLNRELPRELERKDVVVQGRIVSLIEVNPRSQKFNFEVDRLSYQSKSFHSPGIIRLRWYQTNVQLRIAQEFRFLVRLKRPHGFQNPGGFDYEQWLFRNRIRATGYVVEKIEAHKVTNGKYVLFAHYREQVQRFLLQSSLTNKGLIAALTIGDRSGVSEKQWEVLRRTGTIHLLAISGLHIGLVASLVYLLGSLAARLHVPCLRWFPASKPAAILATTAAVGYSAMAGFTIPTQRALVMIAVVMGALLWGRRVSLFRCCMIALFCVLVIDPLSTLDTGFWLSFGALAAICFGFSGRGTNGKRWHHMLRIQLVLTLCLAPILAHMFGQVSVVSPLANVIAIPIVGFLVVPVILVGMIAFLLGYINLGNGLFSIGDWVLSWLWPLLSHLSTYRWSVWSNISLGLWETIVTTLGIGCLAYPWALKYRVIGLVGLLPLVNTGSNSLSPGEFTVSVLDVGQGLSLVVRTSGHVLVYDAGARFSDRFNIGDAVVLPFLKSQGVSHIDTFVVSHGDNDHSGGAKSVVRGIEVQARLSSVQNIVENAKPCLAGQTWVWDQVSFEILHPRQVSPPPHNNSSCVIRVENERGSMLLTGDIEATAEHRLVAHYGKKLKSDVLLVPHQGSKTSSTSNFLDTVKPKIGVVSTGYLNIYGHPDRGVLQRYLDRGIHFYDTAKGGAIELYFNKEGIRVRTYREWHRRYWFGK